MDTKIFQIHWRSVITGATGHGKGMFTKEQAEQIVKGLNRENDGILVHWCQVAEQSEYITDKEMMQLDGSA